MKPKPVYDLVYRDGRVHLVKMDFFLDYGYFSKEEAMSKGAVSNFKMKEIKKRQEKIEEIKNELKKAELDLYRFLDFSSNIKSPKDIVQE